MQAHHSGINWLVKINDSAIIYFINSIILLTKLNIFKALKWARAWTMLFLELDMSLYSPDGALQ